MTLESKPEAKVHQANVTAGLERQLIADKNNELRYLRRLADRQANRLRGLEESLSLRKRHELVSLPAHHRKTNPVSLVEAELGERSGKYFPLGRPAGFPLPLSARPGNTANELLGKRTSTIGVCVFSLDAPQIEAVVDAVRESQRRPPGFVPVFLTGSTEMSVFRYEGFVCEYFPRRGMRCNAPDGVDVEAYYLDKMRFILAKWGIGEVICFGNGKFPPFGAAPRTDREDSSSSD